MHSRNALMLPRPPYLVIGIVTSVFALAVSACRRTGYAIPQDCSPVHGGVAVTPARPASWTRGERTLVPNDSAIVLIRVTHGRDERGLDYARVIFGDVRAPTATAYTDPTGLARVRLPEGNIAMTILRLGFNRYDDTISIRGGVADTLTVGMGSGPICLT